MAVTLTWTNWISPADLDDHDVTLPSASARAGQRLIVFVAGSALPVLSAPNWTQIGATIGTTGYFQNVLYRDCDGTSADNLVITCSPSSNNRLNVNICQIPKGKYSTTAPLRAGTGATGTGSTQINPPAFASAPFSGSPPVLFLVGAVSSGSTAWGTLPSGYAGGASNVGTGTPNVAGLSTCTKEVAASSSGEDPGLYGVGPVPNWSSNTIAVKLSITPAPGSLHTNAQVHATYQTNRKLRFAYKPSTRFDNAQAFYAPSIVLASLPLNPPRHDNTQAFYGPSLAATYAPPFHTNDQTFPAHKIKPRHALAARFDNAQVFYGPKLKATYKVSARFDNAQTFYGGAIIAAPPPATIVAPFFTNAQAFYGPTLVRMQRLSPALHTNAQTFNTEKLLARYKVTARFDNEQIFYDAGITRAGKVAAPFLTNTQVFYAPNIVAPRFLAPARHTNNQTFYAPTLHFGYVTTAPFFTNVQTFYAPKLNVTIKLLLASLSPPANAFFGPKLTTSVRAPYRVNAQTFYGVTLRFAPRLYPTFHVNEQTFYGPSLKTPQLIKPSFHVNQQTFFSPGVNIKPLGPGPGAVSTIGPGWWSKGIKREDLVRLKKRAEEKNEWLLPSADDLPPVRPALPVVVTPVNARALIAQRREMLEMAKASAKKRSMRERIIENQIVDTIVRLLKEE